MSRRWFKHVAQNGRIGWEREGSGWISWGWDPNPPDYSGPIYLDPRDEGALYTQLRLQRQARGVDMATGLPDPKALAFRKRQAQRRRMLMQYHRERYPTATPEQRQIWVKNYLKKYTNFPPGES